MDTQDSDYPANISTPGTVAIGAIDYGVIDSVGDADWFKISLSAGQDYRFTIEAGTINGLFDPQLAIYSATGDILEQATIGQGFQSKYIEFVPTATADYFLSASGASLVGSYKITTANDSLGAGGNSIVGTTANDTLYDTSGNDSLDGGTGIDIANYTGNLANFTFAQSGTGFIVTDTTGAEGVDTLTNIERLQFADKKLALDLLPTQSAGQALEFIGVLASGLVSSPSVVGAILSFFDQGYSMSSLSQLALDVGLVNQLAGSSSNTDLARLVFRNVVGGEADSATVDMLVGYMDGRSASFSQAEFLATVAGLELNQQHIGLIGLQQTGIEFV